MSPKSQGRVNNTVKNDKFVGDYVGKVGDRRLPLDDQATSSSTSSRVLESTTSLHAHHHYTNNNAQKFKNFEEVLATYHEEPMMVIFTAVNCGPCKLMKQELKQVKTMIDGKVRMFAVDTEKFPHIGSRFDIRALPCLLLVHNGEALLRIEGVLKAEEVLERVRTITFV